MNECFSCGEKPATESIKLGKDYIYYCKPCNERLEKLSKLGPGKPDVKSASYLKFEQQFKKDCEKVLDLEKDNIDGPIDLTLENSIEGLFDGDIKYMVVGIKNRKFAFALFLHELAHAIDYKNKMNEKKPIDEREKKYIVYDKFHHSDFADEFAYLVSKYCIPIKLHKTAIPEIAIKS